jgi:hypothetical protein
VSRVALAAGLGAWLVLAGAAPRASAHPANVAYADVVIGERAVDVRLSANLLELDLLLSLDADLNGRVEPHDLEARRAAVSDYLGRALVVTSAGVPLPLEVLALDTGQGDDGKALLEARLKFPADRPLGHVAIRCRVLTELGQDHTTLARIMGAGDTEGFVFRGDAVYTGTRSRLAATLEFLRLGMVHIAIGYDHIAFLVGLLLAGGPLLRVLAIVTAFTAAHTVTLTLAALGVVRPPGPIVEAGIALSIVWVAVENLFARQVIRRWLIGFAFGLIHGFGFAAILGGVGLPRRGLLTALFAFNVGVELAQVMVVLAVVPVLWYLRTSRLYRPTTQVASAVILLMGVYWLYHRLA